MAALNEIEVDFGDNVDVATFEQILEMDDPDDDENTHEFSRSIVFGYIDQAESTFEKMESALKNKDLEEISSLGHFLKGSSATLGFTKVKDECEKLQNYGKGWDETGNTPEPNESICLQRSKEALEKAKGYFAEVEKLMKKYFELLG